MMVTIQVVGVILIVTIAIFIYLNKKNENRNNEKRERLRQKQDDILELLRQRNVEKKIQADKEGDDSSS